MVDEILYLRIRSTYIDEQIYEVVLTRYRLESTVWQKYFQRNGGETRGLRDFARRRRRRRKEIERERERREALFCLREETRFEETGSLPFAFSRRTLLTSLTSYDLPPCRIFSLSGPSFHSLHSSIYEIRRPICQSFMCQNTLSYWRRVYDVCYVPFIPILHRMPAFPLSMRREKGCIWHVPKVSLLVGEILLTLRLCVEIHIDTINPFARDGVRIIKIKLLILHNNLRIYLITAWIIIKNYYQ